MPADVDIGDLFDRYFDDVYGYVAYRLAPATDPAGDISQDVFVAALRGLGSLRRGESARSWLLQIARNKVIDHLRNRARANHHDPPSLRLVERDVQGASSQQEETGRAHLVSAAMRLLPPRQAELLEDKYIRGLSVREIATQQCVTEKAVESALSRAREAFRRALEVQRAKEESPR